MYLNGEHFDPVQSLMNLDRDQLIWAFFPSFCDWDRSKNRLCENVKAVNETGVVLTFIPPVSHSLCYLIPCDPARLMIFP